ARTTRLPGATGRAEGGLVRVLEGEKSRAVVAPVDAHGSDAPGQLAVHRVVEGQAPGATEVDAADIAVGALVADAHLRPAPVAYKHRAQPGQGLAALVRFADGQLDALEPARAQLI